MMHRTLLTASLLTAGLALTPSLASATTYLKFYEGGTGYTSAFGGAGTIYDATKGLTTLCPTSAPGCGAADVLGQPLTFNTGAVGGTLTTSATVGLPGATGRQVWDDLVPNYGGLGVNSIGAVGNSDNIEGAEVLKLSFANTVTLTGIGTLFDPGHAGFGSNFATAASVTAAASTIDFQLSLDGINWTDISFLTANTNGLSFTGNNFYVRQDVTGAADPSFYVGALAITAVPEPASWAMFLVGFGGIGFMMRRPLRRIVVPFG
jgi:hypothetical protein